MKKNFMMIVSLMVLVFALSACAEEEATIVVGEGDWDSNALHDQIVKVIVEEGYGVMVDVVTADTAVMVSGLKTKDIDVVMELWSSNVLTYDEDISNGDYVELAINFDDNMQGLYVPAYLVEGDQALAPDLKTVMDLKNYANLFPDPEEPDKGIIYGGPEGWGATAFLHNKMEVYGLDEYFNFKTIDSNATLTATLSGAYQKEEPWVGYNWEPTWVMGLYDMVLLTDTPYSEEDYIAGNGSFPSVPVTVCVNSDFEEEYPELAEFFKNYTTSSALTSAGLAYMQSEEVEADVAAKWLMKENIDLFKAMMSDDAFTKVETALNQ
jgi:glycine betaine/proline transport system substrate-binding protein